MVAARAMRLRSAPTAHRDSTVCVFAAALDVPDRERDRLAALLSSDEIARAGRLRFDRDRRRFIVARGVLRTILGEYLGVSPRSIRFRYEPGGKPGLAARRQGTTTSHARHSLTFNLSHAGDLALVAVGWRCRIGVDIEQALLEFDTSDLEQHCLAPSEIATLSVMGTAARRRAFFQCWTRKESYLKGVGTGIAIPLDAIAIEPRSDVGGGLRVVGADSAGWQVHDLAAPPGYVAAIAVDTSRPVISCSWSNWATGSRG